MASFIGPKFFLSSAFFIITILSAYGIVGAIYNHFQTTKQPNFGEWPFNTRPLALAFIFVQCLFPIVGLFGVMAACRKRPVFLFGSGSVLLAIFTCSCVFGLVAYHISSEQILESFYRTFKKDTDMSNRTALFEWLTEVQWQHHCCGVFSYKDWYTVHKFRNQETRIPATCCQQYVYQKISCEDLLLSEKPPPPPLMESYLYNQGCGEIVAKSRKEFVELLGIEMIVCGIISLLVAIYLYAGVTKFFLVSANACATANASGSGQNSQSPRSEGGNAVVQDENNNNVMRARNGLGRITRRGRGTEKWPKKRQSSPYPSIHSQGDAPSNLLTPICEEKDTDVPKKNVDMLWYQALDKNMSTLSTTPIDMSSMLLPFNLQNKKTGLVSEDEVTTQLPRNALFTLVDERSFSASVSQNCSGSMMNNNPLKLTSNDEITGQEHSSPNSSCCKSNRLTCGENDASVGGGEKMVALASPTVPIPEVMSEEQIAEPGNILVQENESKDLLSSDQMNSVLTTQHPTTQNSKYANPTSSVRSSTLATIQEESESTKGSPKSKGASPASGCLTPETVTPQPTQTELFSDTSKESRTAPCVLEINRKNNNDDSNVQNTIETANDKLESTTS